MSKDITDTEANATFSSKQLDSDTKLPDPQLPQLPDGQFLSTEMVIVLLTGLPPGTCI